jgi:predicted anti-sigma-YlaC factor YlaD
LRFARCFLIEAILVVSCSGCSIERYAINKVGDIISSGRSIYESDEDIAFVGDALPFSLKLVESLLEESPRHRGLLLTAARGFTVYSNVYVHFEADVAVDEDLERARDLRGRARRFYLRAHRYALRGLDAFYPGFGARLALDPETAVREIETKKAKQVLPFLYWGAASLGLAISVSKNDASMIARLPEVEALLERAVVLDEAWEDGALYEFYITLAGATPGEPNVNEIRSYYDRAMELSQGKRASVHLALAETVSVPAQNAREFRALLSEALAVDPDSDPRLRLSNLVTQRRARWLLSRIDELFLEHSGAVEPGGGAR